MIAPKDIPVFTLFGETEAFPDVVHCERIIDRAPSHGWTISTHRHAHMVQAFWIEDGSAVGRVDGHSHTLGQADVLFVPAQVVHSFVFAPGTAGVVLSFPMTLVTSIEPMHPQIGEALSQTIVGRADDRLTTLFTLMADTLAAPSVFRTQAAVALAHAVLVALAEMGVAAHPTDPAQPHSRMRQLDALVATHLAKGWGPRDYAAALSVSTGHLGRMCRAAKGVGTSAYIEGVAMQEACRLLAFTRLAAAEVGYRLGYTDPTYFSRRFRLWHGKSPSAYRRQYASPQRHAVLESGPSDGCSAPTGQDAP